VLNSVLHRSVLRRDHEIAKYVPWLVGEIRRNDGWIVSRGGKALSKYDARPWVGELGKPAAYLLTTKDQLVPVAKQRELASALDAHVVEIEGDHFVTLSQPAQYATATREALHQVVQRVG
jgi:diacylglycerol O-acyltransferase